MRELSQQQGFCDFCVLCHTTANAIRLAYNRLRFEVTQSNRINEQDKTLVTFERQVFYLKYVQKFTFVKEQQNFNCHWRVTLNGIYCYLRLWHLLCRGVEHENDKLPSVPCFNVADRNQNSVPSDQELSQSPVLTYEHFTYLRSKIVLITTMQPC